MLFSAEMTYHRPFALVLAGSVDCDIPYTVAGSDLVFLSATDTGFHMLIVSKIFTGAVIVFALLVFTAYMAFALVFAGFLVSCPF